MNSSSSESSRFQVCVPKSPEHRRGMKWFSSLTRAAETNLARQISAPRAAFSGTSTGTESQMSLQHAIQLYRVFAETGDRRYLDLCEDFLRYSLKPKTLPNASRLR